MWAASAETAFQVASSKQFNNFFQLYHSLLPLFCFPFVFSPYVQKSCTWGTTARCLRNDFRVTILTFCPSILTTPDVGSKYLKEVPGWSHVSPPWRSSKETCQSS